MKFVINLDALANASRRFFDVNGCYFLNLLL